MRIAAFAYACEPGRGSEPGAGWAWWRLLARDHDVWLLTRTNQREAIEAALAATPERARMHPVFVDLPGWAAWWKRGQRGVRLYYLLWQIAALRRARRIPQRVDLAWHLTLANAWLGSTAALLGVPFVYGPVGGGTGAPLRLLPALGLRGAAYELLRAAVRWSGRWLNPLARIAWRRASLILVQNPETRAWLPRRYRAKTRVLPNVALEQARAPGGEPRATRVPGTALFAGRLLPWKGAALAIAAIQRLPGWRLDIVGSGPDAGRLARLARARGCEQRVRFLGELPREALRDRMRVSDALLLPSLHDEAGWVVAEAQQEGTPVVCLDRGGPPLLGGTAVPATSPGATAAALARALAEATRAGRVPPSARASLDQVHARVRRLLADADLVPVSAVTVRG